MASDSGTQESLISRALDKPITWRSLVWIALAFAGEYALLALIEDAPAILKIATMLCAVAALLVLQTESWFHRQHKYLFAAAITAVSAIYLGFVGYAVSHGLERQAAQAELRKIYASVEPLIVRTIPTLTDGGVVDPKAVDQFQLDAIAWESKTAKWLEQNFSIAARERFLDMAGVGTICWTRFCEQPYNGTRNRLIQEKRNLATIIESPAYEQ